MLDQPLDVLVVHEPDVDEVVLNMKKCQHECNTCLAHINTIFFVSMLHPAMLEDALLNHGQQIRIRVTKLLLQHRVVVSAVVQNDSGEAELLRAGRCATQAVNDL